MESFGVDLTSRDVIRDNGAQVGEVDNVTVNPSTGELAYLIVDPAKQKRSPPFETTRSGQYKVPTNLVQAVDDCVVIKQ